MAPKSRPREDLAQTLVKVAAHPVRVGALAILTEGSASPKQIANELDVPVGNVSYHVHELEGMGLVELIDEQRRRGAVEHIYEAVPRPAPSREEWEKLDLEERQSHSAWTLQMLLADATRSLGAGSLDSRPDRQLSRSRIEVDEQGWKELVAIQAEAARATAEVAAASAARLRAAAGEDGIPVLAAQLCFEAPARRRPRPAA